MRSRYSVLEGTWIGGEGVSLNPRFNYPIRLIELFAGYGSQAMAMKRAGNSIVVDVMTAMFKSLFFGTGNRAAKDKEQLTLWNCEGGLR